MLYNPRGGGSDTDISKASRYITAVLKRHKAGHRADTTIEERKGADLPPPSPEDGSTAEHAASPMGCMLIMELHAKYRADLSRSEHRTLNISSPEEGGRKRGSDEKMENAT